MWQPIGSIAPQPEAIAVAFGIPTVTDVFAGIVTDCDQPLSGIDTVAEALNRELMETMSVSGGEPKVFCIKPNQNSLPSVVNCCANVVALKNVVKQKSSSAQVDVRMYESKDY